MKRQPLFCAMALALGLAVTGPAMAAQSSSSQVKTLHAQIDKQQQQLDAQQQQIQMLREALQKLESQQQAQQQEMAQAKAAPAPAPAPAMKAPVTSAPGVSVGLHGFVNATVFSQNKNFVFNNGQGAEFPAGGSSGTLSGMDVRASRFWLDFSGAKFSGDWVGGGRIEMDFYGGYNGASAFSQQQPYPRLRQAYMTLSNAQSGTTIKIGQQWDLMFPLDNLPPSLTHIAFPLGFGTSYLGWRMPGIAVMQNLGDGSGAQWRLDFGAYNGSWNGPGNNDNFNTAGNVGFKPQVQARLHVKGSDWLGYLSASYGQLDLSGVDGMAPTPIKKTINSTGVQLGGAWTPGDFVLKANLFSGTAVGQIFGNLTQFGDIKGNGGFVSAGYKLTSNWSTNLFYGVGKSNRSDVIAWLGGGRINNKQSAINLNYTAGSYGFGVEYMHDVLDTVDGANVKSSNSGNQVSLSAIYHF